MIMDRVAGAPISWGVCEVPGWGYQVTAEQVLPRMVEIGLVAAPSLPASPKAKVPRPASAPAWPACAASACDRSTSLSYTPVGCQP
jgi:hypothetical protein